MNWKLWASYFVVGAIVLVLMFALSPTFRAGPWTPLMILGAWIGTTIIPGIPAVLIARFIYRKIKRSSK